MKKKLQLFFILSVLLLSCTKKEGETFTPDFKLQIQAMHHTWPAGGIKMYLKYNQQTFPGTNPRLYDDSATADPNGFVIFDSLYYGDYFVYAYGYDNTFGSMVTGNGLMKLTKLNVSGGEMDTVLMVSE